MAKKTRYCSVIACGHGDITGIDVDLLSDERRKEYANVATYIGSSMSGAKIPVCDSCKSKLDHCGLTWRKV